MLKYMQIIKKSVPVYYAVDGGWIDWGHWNTCTFTCGNGTQTWSRTCNNPTPSDGGETCHGINTDTHICNLNTCPGRIE